MGMEDNTISILESPNMKMGTGTRIWECVIIKIIYIFMLYKGVILAKYFYKENEKNESFE